MAKKDGRRVAEVMNQALEDYLNGGYKNRSVAEEENSNSFTLKNDGDISLSKKDVQSLAKAVGSFRIETSGKLVFEKDLDTKTLDSIERIVIHDGTIEVPQSLFPYFLLKSDIYGKIEKY